VPKTAKKGSPHFWKRENQNLTNSHDIVDTVGSWEAVLRSPRKLQQVPLYKFVSKHSKHLTVGGSLQIMSIVIVLAGLSSGFAYGIDSALLKALLKNRIKE
jgi:hypothetical protein